MPTCRTTLTLYHSSTLSVSHVLVYMPDVRSKTSIKAPAFISLTAVARTARRGLPKPRSPSRLPFRHLSRLKCHSRFPLHCSTRPHGHPSPYSASYCRSFSSRIFCVGALVKYCKLTACKGLPDPAINHLLLFLSVEDIC